MKYHFAFALVALSLVVGGRNAAAAPMLLINPGLSGTTSYDEWKSGSLTAANNPGYSSFPGSGVWPAPIGSSAPGSGDATVMKTANGTSGGYFPSGEGLYTGGFSSTPNIDGGQLRISDPTAVSGLKTVAFQLQIGEAFGWDFFNDVRPTLKYTYFNGVSNVTTAASAATNYALLEQLNTGTFDPGSGPEPIFINTYLLNWDLSNALGPISSFDIEFNGVQHSQVYAMRLDQSNVAVPEPSSVVLMGVGVIGFAAYLRRRRSAPV